MTLTLRLDTYPEAQIAAHMTPQNPPPATPTLCCLLHTGSLSSTQQVEVWIDGTQQIPEPEGSQFVFSWSCLQGIEMSIHLKQNGRLTKSWRGWWQGETAIAHTGTLPVQVFCAGVLQPAGLPRTEGLSVGAAALLKSSADQHNGTHHDGGVAEAFWEAITAPTSVVSPTTEEPEAPEDDLWGQVLQHALPGERAEPEAVPSPEPEAWEETPSQEDVEEDTETLQEQTAEALASPRAQEDAQAHESLRLEADIASLAAPIGAILASFPVATVWSQTAHQEQETGLTALLATMPANTILVDLRQHTPTPRRGLRNSKVSGPQKLGISKALLRNQYGARYWDRGATIQTTRRLISTPPPTWGRVVTNPDDPDGLVTLVTALTQGFSLVVLDGETKYAESARAAVLAELRQRVVNLTIGSCS
jgi:hypothetical protein